MIRAVVLIGIVAAVVSLPTDPAYIIKEETAEGRHVQMGEPGKSVSGYYTSRSADGLMEYKTMYEADENGYRARGDHLPVSSPIATAEARSGDAEPKYIIKQEGAEGRHVQMGEPGKSVSGYYISRSADGLMEYKTMYEADENGYRARGDHLPVSSPIATAEARYGDAEPKYVFNYDARSHSHVQMGEPGKSVQGSYMYYDAQGRARTVNYEADDKGYRVLPATSEDKPVEISKETDATVVKAAEPVVKVATEPEIKPAEPETTKAAEPETTKAAEPAEKPTIKFAEAEVKSSATVVAAAEPSIKVPAGFIPLPVPYPGAAYYRGALPYVQPLVHYTPYPYSYGYSYTYPTSGANYLYAL